MKYFIIVAALAGISFSMKAQKMTEFEKQLQLERSKRFPYTGKLHLSQNFPNPVPQDRSALINYRAIDALHAEIVIYDNRGQIILINKVEPGVGEFEIHGSQLKQGNYYYALVVNGRRVSRKRLTVSGA